MRARPEVEVRREIAATLKRLTALRTEVKVAARADADPLRRIYGDLADDIELLRGRGHLVARFKGQIRVDNDVLSDDQVRAKARLLRQPAAKAVAPTPLPRITDSDTPDLRARVAQLEQQVAHLFEGGAADHGSARREDHQTIHEDFRPA